MSKKVITVCEDEGEVIKKLCNLIEKAAEEAIASRSKFTLGLSGGSVVKFLSTGLPNITTDWPKWKFFFCDERVVPFNDEDSTYGVYKKELLGKIPIQDNQFVKIDPNLQVEDAAVDYENKLKSHFPTAILPQFDMLTLGMGPDGHTCSLFPGHPLLQETLRWVAPISDSPKPPPCRVTFTYPVINNAGIVVFAAAGAGKAEIVRRVLEGEEANALPAARVRPHSGDIHWILDKSAASLLKKL